MIGIIFITLSESDEKEMQHTKKEMDDCERSNYRSCLQREGMRQMLSKLKDC